MSRFQYLLAGSERVLLTLWVGGMWFLGYIVVPLLFNTLESRPLAGMVAGHLFTAIHYTGLVCGVLLLVMVLTDVGRRRAVVAWILIVMLALVVVNQFLLQPMMAELKLEGLVEGGEVAAHFAKLHGVSSVLYLVTSVLGLVLVLRQGSSMSS